MEEIEQNLKKLNIYDDSNKSIDNIRINNADKIKK